MNLEGNWVGIIVYGKRYLENEGRELHFDLTISSQNGNIITGETIDTFGFGKNPYPASIKGTITDNNINFIKQYPFQQYLNENNEFAINKEKKGHKIKYTGYYDNNSNKFKGDWIIFSWVFLFGLIPIRFRSFGTWEMRKS